MAAIRLTRDIDLVGEQISAAFKELKQVSAILKKHHRNMRDMEFTIERGKLGTLPNRNGKRTARVAERIAVDMAHREPPTRQEAVCRVSPNQKILMVRPEATPDDVHGMLAARGIGLCRTEHMFFQTERLPLFQQMIMADQPVDRRAALDLPLPNQRKDVAGLCRLTDGLPLIIRLIDPPLHEFPPDQVDPVLEPTDLKLRIRESGTLVRIGERMQQIQAKERLRSRAAKLQKQNPMPGPRGVRLGIHIPEWTKMQVRAIFETACQMSRDDIQVYPEAIIPRIAAHAESFSCDTNNLTRTACGISRHPAQAEFLIEYMERPILPGTPFSTLDRDTLAEPMHIKIGKNRRLRPDLEWEICDEHSGAPRAIPTCHEPVPDHDSCSPFRAPTTCLAAAHAKMMGLDGGAS